MMVITIAAAKGGVGKTVTAMALASAFARAGHETVLVDVDPQGHSTLGLGVDVGETGGIVSDLFHTRPRPLCRILRTTAVPQLALVPSHPEVQDVASGIASRPRRVLQEALRTLSPAPAFVVIDCPPSLGPLTENAIVAADWLLVPCLMEARAPEGLADVLQVRERLLQQGLLAGDGWRILYTKYDARRRYTNRTMDAALASHGRTLATVIPQSEPLNQAQMAKVDIFTYAPTSPGATQYRALATEISALTGGRDAIQ